SLEQTGISYDADRRTHLGGSVSLGRGRPGFRQTAAGGLVGVRAVWVVAVRGTSPWVWSCCQGWGGCAGRGGGRVVRCSPPCRLPDAATVRVGADGVGGQVSARVKIFKAG